MRKTVLSLAVVSAACVGFAGMASAQGVDIDVGRGGVHVGPDYHRYDRDSWRWRHRETSGFGGECRVIIRHEWRDGERVTIRRRICD